MIVHSTAENSPDLPFRLLAAQALQRMTAYLDSQEPDFAILGVTAIIRLSGAGEPEQWTERAKAVFHDAPEGLIHLALDAVVLVLCTYAIRKAKEH